MGGHVKAGATVSRFRDGSLCVIVSAHWRNGRNRGDPAVYLVRFTGLELLTDRLLRNVADFASRRLSSRFSGPSQVQALSKLGGNRDQSWMSRLLKRDRDGDLNW